MTSGTKESPSVVIDPKATKVNLGILISIVSFSVVGAFYLADLTHTVEDVAVTLKEVRRTLRDNNTRLLQDLLSINRLEADVRQQRKEHETFETRLQVLEARGR